jgi:hypothetical protein
VAELHLVKGGGWARSCLVVQQKGAGSPQWRFFRIITTAAESDPWPGKGSCPGLTV